MSDSTIELLQKHFDLAVEAPDGIAKLRGLILTLAMQGRLVPQDPNDCVVDVFDAHISKARARSDRTKAVEPSLVRAPNWLEKAFGNVFELQYGENLPAETRSETGEFQVYGSNGVVGTHRMACVCAPCVIVGRKGSAGAVNLSLEKACWVTDVAYYCVPPVGIDLRFCYYLFVSLNLPRFGKGIVPGLTRSEIYALSVPLPPHQEQRRIVAKIDELLARCDELESKRDALVQKRLAVHNAAIRRLIEAQDASEFTSAWDFLAVHFGDVYSVKENIAELRKAILHWATAGKLAMYDPSDEALINSFPGVDTLKETPNDRLPSNWSVFRYGDLTTVITSGSRGWKNFYSDSGALFIRTQNIKTDHLVLDDVAFVKLPQRVEGARTRVNAGDILLTITGANVTKAALVETEIEEAYVSQHIALARPRWIEMAKWLHLCFLSPGAARGRLELLAYGDKPGLNLDNIRDLRIPVPPLSEQHRIVAKVDQLMAICDRVESLIELTTTQKTAIFKALLATT